eukprot:1331969-Amorphochlora_amoeboformis.AAC.1
MAAALNRLRHLAVPGSPWKIVSSLSLTTRSFRSTSGARDSTVPKTSGVGYVDGEIESLEAAIHSHVSDSKDKGEMERILYGASPNILQLSKEATTKAKVWALISIFCLRRVRVERMWMW